MTDFYHPKAIAPFEALAFSPRSVAASVTPRDGRSDLDGHRIGSGYKVANNIALASYHRMIAVVFWESAKMLNESFEARGQRVVGNRMAVPFYYLACHAAEMLLKCALLKRNVIPAELKKQDVRHSLGELLKLIEKKGVPISERATQLVASLDGQHKDHALRYLFLMEDSEPVFTPPAEDIFSLLEELLTAGRISTHRV
jgi:HEPN domain-containing protein